MRTSAQEATHENICAAVEDEHHCWWIGSLQFGVTCGTRVSSNTISPSLIEPASGLLKLTNALNR